MVSDLVRTHVKVTAVVFRGRPARSEYDCHEPEKSTMHQQFYSEVSGCRGPHMLQAFPYSVTMSQIVESKTSVALLHQKTCMV